jgi:hypothetical protein
MVAMSQWEKREPAWVTRKSFTNQRQAIIEQLRRKVIVERAARLIQVSDEAKNNARLSRFVEHLSLIECCDDDVDRAIEDFIRFGAEAYRLSVEGDIPEDEWIFRGDRLQRRWQRILRQQTRSQGDAVDTQIGENIYRETVDAGHLEPLADESTHEEYLTAGHYHRLANADQVWWHPKYSTKELE